MDFLYITGSIPFSLDNLRNLAFLYLSYNQLNQRIHPFRNMELGKIGNIRS
ncbi:hypothetical protein NC651_004778 [Populus alba x Populus x berolinensis]|nr:hypothetical protein NC651_004778 [Populus alba x Populus x berolinensis]